MKTRIKVVKYRDGHVEYIPQYKQWFFWHYMYTWNSVDSYRHECDAQGRINLFLRYHAESLANKERYKVVSVSYRKYP